MHLIRQVARPPRHRTKKKEQVARPSMGHLLLLLSPCAPWRRAAKAPAFPCARHLIPHGRPAWQGAERFGAAQAIRAGLDRIRLIRVQAARRKREEERAQVEPAPPAPHEAGTDLRAWKGIDPLPTHGSASAPPTTEPATRREAQARQARRARAAQASDEQARAHAMVRRLAPDLSHAYSAAQDPGAGFLWQVLSVVAPDELVAGAVPVLLAQAERITANHQVLPPLPPSALRSPASLRVRERGAMWRIASCTSVQVREHFLPRPVLAGFPPLHLIPGLFPQVACAVPLREDLRPVEARTCAPRQGMTAEQVREDLLLLPDEEQAAEGPAGVLQVRPEDLRRAVEGDPALRERARYLRSRLRDLPADAPQAVRAPLLRALRDLEWQGMAPAFRQAVRAERRAQRAWVACAPDSEEQAVEARALFGAALRQRFVALAAREQAGERLTREERRFLRDARRRGSHQG